MIDTGTDRKGHSLRMLVAQALRDYRTEALLPLLKDKDAIVRSAVARQLQLRGGATVLAEALSLLRDPIDQSREIAAFVLGQLGTPRAPYRSKSVRALMDLLSREKSVAVLASALSSLGHLRAQEAVPHVLRFSAHKHPDVRGALAYFIGSAYALSGTPANGALRVLEKLGEDPDRGVRADVVLAKDLLLLSSRSRGDQRRAIAGDTSGGATTRSRGKRRK
jgi:hypothetical protein